MASVRHIVGLALAALAATGCGVTAEQGDTQPFPAIESATFGSMRNVSAVGKVWFGGGVTPEDLDLASRRGVETVIDLSAPEDAPDFDVRRACRSLGMEYVHALRPSADPLDDTAVDLVLAHLNRPDGAPTLMFCGSGARCAMFLAIYRATSEGVPLELALVEARRGGMKPGEPEEFVRAQVERLDGAGRTARGGGGGGAASAHDEDDDAAQRLRSSSR